MSEHVERANDAYKKMNFFVEVDGIANTAFKNVEGLHKEFAVVEERDGNEPNRMRKQRGMESFDDVVLTRGLTSESGFLEDWYDSGDRRSVSIVQLNHNQEEVKRWNLVEAFPQAFDPIEDMDSSSETDVQVEKLTLAHEGFDRS